MVSTVSTKAQKFGTKHRDAIARYVVDEGTSAPEFARRAAAGDLEDLEPFSISEQRVRDIRGEIVAARDRAQFAEVDDVAKRCRNRAWTMVDDMLAELRANQLKRTDRQVKDLASFEKCVSLIAKLEGKPGQPSKPPSDKPDEDTEAEKQRQALEARLSRQPSSKGTAPRQGNTQEHADRSAADNGRATPAQGQGEAG